MPQPIQLDPVNTKFFLPKVIPFTHKQKEMQHNQNNDQLCFSQASVIAFKDGKVKKIEPD